MAVQYLYFSVLLLVLPPTTTAASSTAKKEETSWKTLYDQERMEEEGEKKKGEDEEKKEREKEKEKKENRFVPTLSNLLAKLEGSHPGISDRILNVYLWGSRVYGTASASSDYDFMVVTTKEEEPPGFSKA